ncbi:hypothetical protein SBP18_05695 [Rhodoferax ferrireducens]|uniref:hypothetical protein n=1 Tax=Rhodoferax ferrireducens TaxID=192843 RepID=UPI00298E214A|nr:hypothetical protein [Rhodoferax ferrireducens]WPC68006.1 hypothetical protein SBP18_05695 [Rhodoferax ferrireducens]
MEPVIPMIGRIHTRRLREVYRSAGWPWQDVVEIELLAAGLLERVAAISGHELVRVTDAGISCMASALHDNRRAFSAHESLVNLVAQAMVRDGRVVWTTLEVRARLPATPDHSSRWKICKPDVFSIRNSSRQEYLEPIVHEIKVSRADLLGDLKRMDKRNAYLDVGGQCWYVLGCDAKDKVIAEPDEIPMECGVMVCMRNKLEVVRMAPKRPSPQLPFGVWMALAKATPVQVWTLSEDGTVDQASLA